MGILTDRDLRSRVVAHRTSPGTPVADVMSFPARTVPEHTLVGEVFVKHGGITIIGSLARAYAIGAGLTEKRTLGRLRALRRPA